MKPQDRKYLRPLGLALGLAVVLAAQPAAAFTKLDVSRVLLMNDDTNTVWEVRGQGYFSTNTADEVYWTHSEEEVPNATDKGHRLWLLRVQKGWYHTLYWRNPGEETPTSLWKLNQCRTGSSASRASIANANATRPSGAKRNFIPWSAANSVPISNDAPSMSASTAFFAAGMVSMLNSTNSWVMSPLYDNIGTIYFDAVNGWTDCSGDIVVEIATNTVGGSGITVETPAENLDWRAIPFNVFTVENKTTVSSIAENVTSFTLNQDADDEASNRMWGNYFYRIRATINHRDSPIRFRIRRNTTDPTTTDVENYNKGNYLILDNIVASYAPIQIDFGPFKGINSEKSYDETRTDTSIVGYEGVLNKMFPGAGMTGARPIAYFKVKENPYVTNAVPSDFTIVNPKFHCRWRYLNQITKAWQTVDLRQYSTSLVTQYISKASSPPEVNAELSNGPGDLEFYYTLELTKQPYFEPFDFACNLPSSSAFGAGWKELVNPMALEFRCTEEEAERLKIKERTMGRDWFVRIREGESDLRDAILSLSVGAAGENTGRSMETNRMALVEDHLWRTYVKISTNHVGKTARIKLHTVESTQKSRIYSDTNAYWSCSLAADTPLPCNVKMEERPGDEPDSSWGEVFIDGTSGYMMFEYNDKTHTLSISRCQYQNFNTWVNPEKYNGKFVGHSTDTNSTAMTGVSADKTGYPVSFDEWGLTKTSDANWEEGFNVNVGDMDFPTNKWFAAHRTPNGHYSAKYGWTGWHAENAMFMPETYSVSNPDNRYGMSLLLQGYGLGALMYDEPDPDYRMSGVGKVSFAARAAQYQTLSDFAYYYDSTTFKDYAVCARAMFTTKGTAEKDLTDSGKPTMSLIGYYRPEKGCYEFRLTRLSATSVEMALYRWDRKQSVLLTNRVESINYLEPTTAASNNSSWPAVYLALYTDSANKKTYLTAAVAKSATSTTSLSDGDFTRKLSFVDADVHVRGAFGVGSNDCPAKFGRVEKFNLKTEKVDSAGNVQPSFSAGSGGIDAYMTEDDWYLADGRMELEGGHGIWTYCIRAREPEQKVRLMMSKGGSGGEWFDSGYYATVTSFVFNAYSLDPRLVDSYSVCLRAGEASDDARVDVLIDDVKMEQWASSSWDGENSFRNWVFGQCRVSGVAEFSDSSSYTNYVYSDSSDTITVFAFTNNCVMIPLADIEVTRAYVVSGNGKLNDVSAASLAAGKNNIIKAGETIRVTVGKGNNYSRVHFRDGASSYYTANTSGTNEPNGDKSVVKLFIRGGGEKIVKMQPRRAVPDKPLMIRSPFLEKGMSLFSFSYRGAETNAIIRLQIATNNVGTANYQRITDAVEDSAWVTVTNYTFKSMPSSGVCTYFFGLREPVKGFVRLICDPGVVEKTYTTEAFDYYSTTNHEYGSVIIDKATIYDEPMLDERSWYGWNMRTTDEEGFAYLPDPAAYPKGRSGMLNFTALSTDPDARLADADLEGEEYAQHDPFVQSPAITNSAGVGQVQFRARVVDPATNVQTYVTLYGCADPQEIDDGKWTILEGPDNPFLVTNRIFQTFSWKTYNDNSPYKAVRLVVKGAKDGKDSPNAVTNPIQRVLIEEIAVTEPIVPSIAFKSITPFRTDLNPSVLKPIENADSMDQQPLLGEAFGIQVEVVPMQLADKIATNTIEVYMSYYVSPNYWNGENYWGYTGEYGWRDNAPSGQKMVKCKLKRCGDTLVWRSTYAEGYENSVIPPQQSTDDGKGVVVQYYVWAEYKDTLPEGTSHHHYVQSGEWSNPSWYYPIDLNEDNGGYNAQDRFCPYTILQSVSPGRAWINCINVYDGNGGAYKTNQFIELAVPFKTDMAGWYLRFTENKTDYIGGHPGKSMTFATLGRGDVRSEKSDRSYNFYDFLTLQSPSTTTARRNSADGTWNSFNRADSSLDAERGVFNYTECYAVELLRPNGIIEHQVVFGGTNMWSGYTFADDFKPDVFRGKMKDKPKPGSNWVLAGADETAGTIGVMKNHGADDSDWEQNLKQTPQRENERMDGTLQDIDDHWYLPPAGTNYWVYSYIYGGFISQSAGEETGPVIRVIMPQGTSTNITYTVEPWHRIDSFVSNNISVSPGGIPFNKATLTYTFPITGISGNMTLSVTSGVDRAIYEGGTGLTPDDPYHNAVVRWLEKLSAANGDVEHDIVLAELEDRGRGYNGKHLSLKEMYWLDIYPFETNRLVVGWAQSPKFIKVPDDSINNALAHPATNNVRFSVYMMITNRETGDAHPPYTIQGLGGESSADNHSNWTSVTFRARGKLHELEPDKWRPLRYFVFDGNSFRKKGEPNEFTAEFDVWDPFSSYTPCYNDKDFRWWPHRDKGLWFSTTIDDKDARPWSIDVLKTNDFLTVEH